jgi:hypothetical protein
MLSLDLFNSKFEKKLREGATDDVELRSVQHLLEPLSRKAADILTQIRSGKLSSEKLVQLRKEYDELVKKRTEIILNRKTQTEQQIPSKQDPFAYVKPEPKGIGDIQDPKTKMAQLQQKAKKGPLANVGAGLKAFIKGEPEPMGEQQEVNPRALGVANFQRLVKANMGNIPTVSLEFIRSEDNFKLDQRGLDLISDYYDGLKNDQAKNYFIYRVLPSGDETLKVLKQLGWNPRPEQKQQSLPGIPTQGELPLQEKKKSDNNDLDAGDVKVARELQKLRAQYPAAKSDVEAVARAEIDSSERSQQQLSAIRGANEKQDALLKQLVALDQEQGREINNLDKENDSLEKQLDQVQSTNARLAQTVNQMTGAKKSTRGKPVEPGRVQTRVIDIIPNAPADAKSKPTAVPDIQQEPAAAPKAPDRDVIGAMARQIQGLTSPAPVIRPAPDISANDSIKKAAESKIKEHGGGIGPRQHWQDLMQEGVPQEAIRRYLAINAETDVEAVRAAIQAISRDSALSANSKSRLLGYIFALVSKHKLPIGRSYYQFLRQYMEEQSVNETVTDVKAGMARIYRRLAPKIERNRDSFLAGQLYDELENYAELHGAEDEFKRMMSTARGRAHMEYDTNPGGFHNWFWFLPFEDDTMTESTDDIKKKMSKLEALALAANRAGNDAKCKMYQQKIQSLKQKLSQSMAEGWSDKYNPTPYSVYIDGREWKAFANDDHARAVAEKVQANLERQGRKQTVTIAPSKTKRVQEATADQFGQAMRMASHTGRELEKDPETHKEIVRTQQQLAQRKKNMARRDAGYGNDPDEYSDVKETFAMPGRTIPRKSLIQGYTVFWNPTTQMVSVTRGGDSEEAAIEQVRVGTPSMKNFRQAADRLIDRIESADEQIIEGAIKDVASATTVIACLLSGGSLSGCATAPQQTSAQQVLKTGQDIGRTLQTAKKITRAGTEEEVRQELRNILRGVSGRPEELNHSNIIRIWKRIKGQPPVSPEPEAPEYGPGEPVRRPATEAKEIVSKEDFLKERDRLLRMIGQETNPANKQILKSAIRQLENRAENEGWINPQTRIVRENSDNGEAVEMAIMRRMLVAHTDLIVEFGLDKVVDAIEEVAYDVGDVDEIGSSDVSGWVNQVKQILGAVA